MSKVSKPKRLTSQQKDQSTFNKINEEIMLAIASLDYAIELLGGMIISEDRKACYERLLLANQDLSKIQHELISVKQKEMAGEASPAIH